MNTTIPDEATLKELEVASIRLAQGAGLILRRYQPGGTKVNYKDQESTDPVTEADLKVEEYLRGEISREFPDHGIVAEESDEVGVYDADYMWVVDPLDGTANFAAGLPFYSVSIGLLYKGVPVLGSLFLPYSSARDGVYHARVGGGAFVDGTPLRVISAQLPKPSGLSGIPASYGSSFSFKRERGKSLGEFRILGSIACEMVLVAQGVLQFSVFMGSHIWDVAAGIVLIREAGGEVLEWSKGRWEPFKGFLPISEKPRGTYQQGLRNWSVPVLTGNPKMVNYLATRTRATRGPLRVLWHKLKASFIQNQMAKT